MKKFLFAITLALCSILSVAQDTTRLSLLFLGDIMQHDSQIADAYDTKTGVYDYRPCFQYVKPYIQAVDVAVGNLEVTLAGKPYKGYPRFSAPDELLVAIRDLGLDAIVTANNHSVDRGRAGVERTITLLDSFRIAHTGTFKTQGEKEGSHPLLIEKHGFRLALLNYTYGTNGLPVAEPNVVNMLDTASMRRDLERAEALNPDAVIVFPHWGAEYQSLPSKNQKQVAEFCFRHGADLVIGAHPHVVQPMQWRKKENQLVAWSLGNFVSGQRKRYTDGGAMIRLELEKVVFPDKSSYTVIDTAEYILAWVYRTDDTERNYYVLPVPTVEPDPRTYIGDDASMEAFRIFVDDSRALFKKYNRNVGEMKSAPQFRVQFSATDTLAVRKYLEANSGVHDLIDVLYPTLQVGPFTLPDAMHVHHRIKFDLPVEDLEIRKE